MNSNVQKTYFIQHFFQVLKSRYFKTASFTPKALPFEQKLHNRFWEWFYRVDTYGIIESDAPEFGRYEPTPYLLMNEILNRLDITPSDHYVDIGCGKGRSLILASQRKMAQVIGIDYDQNLINTADTNVSRLRRLYSPVQLFCGQAQDFDYRHITKIFMYNPFGPRILKEVIGLIEKTLADNPRDIKIAYANPQQSHILLNSNWFEQYDAWQAQDFPDFEIYPRQPIAVSFWTTKQVGDIYSVTSSRTIPIVSGILSPGSVHSKSMDRSMYECAKNL